MDMTSFKNVEAVSGVGWRSESKDLSNNKSEAFLNEVDWDQYSKYRPQYPSSLTTLLTDYHRAHSNSFRLAHDVGSGSGVFAPTLAEYFQHVHVSDPKPQFIQQARQRLDTWFAENWWKGRFTFSVGPAEDADQVAAKGSVDLVTLMQCAHWTDQSPMVEAVARSLAPNGTLAIVLINPEPSVVGNERVSGLVKNLFAFWVGNIIENAGGKESGLYKTYIPQGNSGLEFVDLPEELFLQDVRKRIAINARGRAQAAYAMTGSESLVAPSRVDPKDKRYEYTSEDPEGEGWQYEVDGAWFRGLIGTMEKEDQLHLYEQHFQEIEHAVEETSASGRVTVEWVVAILFATRK